MKNQYFRISMMCAALFGVYATILRQECKIYAEFKIVVDGLADSGSVLKEFPSKTKRQCTLECISLAECASVNYQLNGGKCQLLERGLVKSTSLLIKKEGWIYMTTDDEEQDVGPVCKERSPCLHGRCLDTCTSKGYQCICDPYYYGAHCDNVIQDCRGVYESGKKENGVYSIYLTHSDIKMDVYCDMVTGKTRWIVIQRRVNNTVDFYRNWQSYKNGFGSLDGNMWFGLDKIHLLAGPGRRAKVRFDLKHWDLGTTVYSARYTTFEVGSEAEKYKLLIGGYTGTAGDSMTVKHNNMMFTTYDNDNDASTAAANCAVSWKGGWWYNKCHDVNLNGIFPTARSTNAKYMSWKNLQASPGNIVFSNIKIRYP